MYWHPYNTHTPAIHTRPGCPSPGARPQRQVGYPTPYTPHPTPYTLHPTPYTYTLHPTPHILHPTPYTLHPTPHTLHICRASVWPDGVELQYIQSGNTSWLSITRSPTPRGVLYHAGVPRSEVTAPPPRTTIGP